MPIDTREPSSPGWWMQRLWQQLSLRQKRYALLQTYAEGNPPLPVGAETCREAFRRFQKMSRTNFADLVVQAMLDRIRLRAVRTAVESDIDGDDVAMRYARRNQLDVGLMDALDWMFTYGRSYMSVGSIDPAIGAPLIRPEDPRQTITATDPVTGVERAAFKIFHDDDTDLDHVYLWLPGELHVASRQRRALHGKVTFSAGSYSENSDLSATWPDRVLPVIELENRRGVGEFEAHTDILDRINRQILDRLVVSAFQAFRQRAIKVDSEADMPERDPETGEKIDYDDVFAADPGALWRLPKGADLWESAQTDFQSIIAAAKSDILNFAAVTRTPLPMFTPDAATQTAEGAQLFREGLVSKCEDRTRRVTPRLARLFSMAFMFDPDNRYAQVGDTRVDRADIDRIGLDWVPPERYSLAERASAASQASAAGVPWEARASEIWQFTPDQVARQQAQRLDDLAFAASAATVAADGGQ